MMRAIMMSSAMLLIALLGLGKEGQKVAEWTVKVTTTRPQKAAFLSITVPTTVDAKSAQVVSEDGQARIAQLLRTGDEQMQVVWAEENLPANVKRTYRIRLNAEPVAPRVQLVTEQKWVTVTIDGQLFTRYYFTPEFAKPFCFPLVGPNGKVLTRGFPVEPREGETRDHPHHKGFWVAHGDVNGHDLWSERAKIVHRSFEALESGPVFGLLRARHDWLGTDGRKLCEVVHELRFSALPNIRILDLIQTFIATEGDVHFGDTKEGFVAIRIPDELTVSRGTGHILLATGHKDRDAWGKRAPWCLYFGTVGGAPVAIGFFDHPQNRSFPNPWHVRDYGLFANGPFGRKDFGLPPEEGIGRLAKGERLTLRYRLVLLSYHPTPEEMEALWAGFAHEPTVERQP